MSNTIRVFLCDDSTSFHEARRAVTKTKRFGEAISKVKFLLNAPGIDPIYFKVRVRPYHGPLGVIKTFEGAVLLSGLEVAEPLWGEKLIAGAMFYSLPSED